MLIHLLSPCMGSIVESIVKSNKLAPKDYLHSRFIRFLGIFEALSSLTIFICNGQILHFFVLPLYERRWWKKIIPYLSIHNVIQLCSQLFCYVWHIRDVDIIKKNSSYMFCYIVIVWHIMTRGWDFASDRFSRSKRNEVNIIKEKAAKES